MSPRSIRRAAERKAKKLALKARKSELPHSAQPSHEAPYGPFGAPSEATGQQIFPRSRSDESPASRPISERQLAANRANAQLSTGPTSSSGRANSCLNAVKTGLTGRTVLLSSDDAAAYQQHVSDFFKEFQPVGPRECALVQSLADNAWRLLRVPALEMAIFAYGRIKFADTFADQDPTLQASLIDMHTFLHYEKQLRNLQIQEARLQRQREKHMTELRQLRQERVRKEKEDFETTGPDTLMHQEQKLVDAAHAGRLSPVVRGLENGFEFSTADLEAHPANSRAASCASMDIRGS